MNNFFRVLISLMIVSEMGCREYSHVNGTSADALASVAAESRRQLQQ
jgi:hypothetical protein